MSKPKRTSKGTFIKGQTGNPYGRAGRPSKTKPNSNIHLSKQDKRDQNRVMQKSDVVFMRHGDKRIPNIPEEESEANRFALREKWQRFGNDNLFPQAIAAVTRKSPAHRGILNNKVIYVMGRGFTTEDNRLGEYIKQVNNLGESLTAMAKKLEFDILTFGNGWMEITTDTNRSFVNLFHKDATSVRLSRSGEAALLHPDWSKARQTQDLIKAIPIYPNFVMLDGALRSIFQYKSYEPEFKHYGIPDWISALDAAGIGYKTNKWNLSRLENAFSPSGVLIVDGSMSDEDAEELKQDFLDEMTGEDRQGKVMFTVKQLGGENTSFTAIETKNEGDWIQLHKQSEQDLIIAHNWFRSLSGLGEPGQLGNTQQIQNEFEIASATVIQQERQFLLEPIKRIIAIELRLDTEDLDLMNIVPISKLQDLNINAITRVWEGRKEVGLDFDKDSEEEQRWIEPPSAPTPMERVQAQMKSKFKEVQAKIANMMNIFKRK